MLEGPPAEGPFVYGHERMRPPYTDEKLWSMCHGGPFWTIEPAWVPYLRSMRGPYGETLLHKARTAGPVVSLLGCGLDPNARDDEGRTPLMWVHDAEGNRALVAGGADLHAVDPAGNTVLAHQSGGLESSVGYSPPDYEALQALIRAGVRLPTPAEAEMWIAGAHACVSHHMEDAAARQFEAWVHGLLTGVRAP